MTNEERWTAVYQRFDPEPSAILDHAHWRAERPYSPLPRMRKQLRLDRFGGDRLSRPRLLLMGTPGTGKSTELRKLADLQAKDDFVLVLDLVQLFEHVVKNPAGLYSISAWEVCYLAGLSLYQAALERLHFPWDPAILQALETAWQGAAAQSGNDPPKARLNMGQLAAAVFKGACLLLDGGAVLAPILDVATKALDWTLPIGKARQQIADDLPESRSLIDAVNRIISEVELRHRRVLLIIDGLDRINEIGRARALFTDTRVLGQFACPTVLCGPFALRHHPDVAMVPGEFHTFALVNEPVVRKDDPSALGAEGYAFLRELFQRRTRDLCGPSVPELIPDPLLRRLTYYSGGRARDFVRLVRAVAGEVLLAEPAQVSATDAMIDTAINEQREARERGLYDNHLALLRRVMDDPKHLLPQSDATTWAMLESYRLLPYPNDHEWFYPHTLLLKLLGAPGYLPPPGSAAGGGGGEA